MSENKPIYKEIEDVIFMPRGDIAKNETNGKSSIGWLLIFISWIIYFISFYVFISQPDNRFSTEDGLSRLAFMFAIGLVTTLGAYNLQRKTNKLDQKIANVIIALIFTFVTFVLISIGTGALVQGT